MSLFKDNRITIETEFVLLNRILVLISFDVSGYIYWYLAPVT